MRHDLIGAAMATTGKTLLEADVEVSEAIDFVDYYPRSLKDAHNNGTQTETNGFCFW